jgi:hypothetical protein
MDVAHPYNTMLFCVSIQTQRACRQLLRLPQVLGGVTAVLLLLVYCIRVPSAKALITLLHFDMFTFVSMVTCTLLWRDGAVVPQDSGAKALKN